MNGFSQIAPISELPRKYRELIRKANYSNQPVVLFRRNKPIAGLVDFGLLQKYQEYQRQAEISDALKAIAEGEKAYREGRTRILKSPSDLWKPWKEPRRSKSRIKK